MTSVYLTHISWSIKITDNLPITTMPCPKLESISPRVAAAKNWRSFCGAIKLANCENNGAIDDDDDD